MAKYIGCFGNKTDKFFKIMNTINTQLNYNRKDNNYCIFYDNNIVINHSQETDSLKIFDGCLSKEESNSEQIGMQTIISLDNKQVTIYRDLMGSRLVYYMVFDDSIFFSSSIKLLLMLRELDFNFTVDNNALKQNYFFGYIVESEQTLINEIKILPPGFCLQYDGKNLTKRIKKELIFKEINYTQTQADSLFAEALEFSVKNMLHIQGNNIIFASGGMDSSALLFLAKQFDINFEALTFSSEANEVDEYCAGELTKALGISHKKLEFSAEEALYLLPDYICAFENLELTRGKSNYGGFAYYLMCRKLQEQGYNCVFPGEGADELLLGYFWPSLHPCGYIEDLLYKAKMAGIYETIKNGLPADVLEDTKKCRHSVHKLDLKITLPNYHLNSIEHIANHFGLRSFPVYTTSYLVKTITKFNTDLLCNGTKTKLLLRRYLIPKLERYNLEFIVTRKKAAMPNVITTHLVDKIANLAKQAYTNIQKHPFAEIFEYDPIACLHVDIFMKYVLLDNKQLDITNEWKQDIERMTKYNEPIIHW